MGKWLNALSEIQQSTDERVPKVPDGSFGTFGTDERKESFEIGASGPDESLLSDALKDSPTLSVRSNLLGADILFAADDTEVPARNRLTVYRESELRRLVGCNPELLRGIHALKVAFNGEIVALGMGREGVAGQPILKQS